MHNIYDPDFYLDWNITLAVALEVININFINIHFTMNYQDTIFLHVSLTFGIAYLTMLWMLILLTSLNYI